MKRSLWLAAALSLLAAPLPAQTLFGLAPDENPANGRDVYRTRVRHEVTVLLGQWKQAWDRDDGRAAADLYTRDGVFVDPSGHEARSRDSLRVKLATVFGGAGSLRWSIQDFDFSGDMAFVRGQMLYATEAAPDAPAPGASYVLIARRQRDDVWLIRSLALLPSTETPSAPPPSGATPAAAPASPAP